MNLGAKTDRTTLIALLCLVSLAIPSLIHAENQDETTTSNPVVAKLLERQVPQTKIGSCSYDVNPVLLYKNIEIDSPQSGDIRISWFSNDGAAWRASFDVAPVADCEVWTADLSPGNAPAIIIIAKGINSSGGWDTNLYLLLFDKQGKPMPWQATSYFDMNEKGVQEIVRTAGSESASIVVPIQDGDKFEGFDYVYELYDVVGDRVRRVTSVRSGVKWPLVPVNKPEVASHHQADTLSTVDSENHAGQDTSAFRVKKLSRNPVSNDAQLEREDGSSIETPAILVVDAPNHERSIIFDPVDEDLLNLVKDNATARLIGKRCDWDNCIPLILQATTR